MVENLNGLIRLDADYINNFSVTVTDDEGKNIQGNLVVHIGNMDILGNYNEELECYDFSIPANSFSGKQDYQFVLDDETLIFPQKMYFV